MKGIYLTEEAKKAIEEKIAELEKSYSWDEVENTMVFSKCETYKEILSSATILPVEDSCENNGIVLVEKKWMFDRYPNGVIIQPKQ